MHVYKCNITTERERRKKNTPFLTHIQQKIKFSWNNVCKIPSTHMLVTTLVHFNRRWIHVHLVSHPVRLDAWVQFMQTDITQSVMGEKHASLYMSLCMWWKEWWSMCSEDWQLANTLSSVPQLNYSRLFSPHSPGASWYCSETLWQCIHCDKGFKAHLFQSTHIVFRHT